MTPERTALQIAEYSPTAAALAQLHQRYAGVAYDLRSVRGDKEARAARGELVKLRTALEAKRKELKAPALERSRLIDAEARQLTAAILELERPIEQQIVADEERRAQEREQRAAAERARVAEQQARIERMRGVAVRAVALPAADIAAKTALLERIVIGDDYAEFAEAARLAREQTLATLRELHARAVERESLAAGEARERAQRQREEQRAERERRERAECEAREAAEREQREQQEDASSSTLTSSRPASPPRTLYPTAAAARAEQQQLVAGAQAAQHAVDAITGAGDDYQRLLVTLGAATAFISRPELCGMLIEDLRGGGLHAGHVATLRDALDDALDAAAA